MPIRESISPGRNLTFGTRVSHLRHEKGLSQVQLGKTVGVSGTCVWNWEVDNTFPRTGALAKLATALSTTPEYLRDGPQSDGPAPGLADGETLSSIIRDCRQQIARAAGLNIAAVRVALDYDA